MDLVHEWLYRSYFRYGPRLSGFDQRTQFNADKHSSQYCGITTNLHNVLLTVWLYSLLGICETHEVMHQLVTLGYVTYKAKVAF
ncbi:hypothetical protein AVEN_197796-1 [Araneus ventricosus]|uniref:Uncharacterized protein n=1 Tax=Araneus ventricosus TaxID=182803 RepID=A0A4Y2HNB7_ARAVE|nr:hypothetical protein AVEN_197796-1 [Araneus ventricosus]